MSRTKQILRNTIHSLDNSIESLKKEKVALELELYEGKIPLDLFSLVKGWSDVVYAFPDSGWPANREKVSNTLTLGKKYRVFNIEIGGSSSEVEVYSEKLNKMVWVNSVMFCQYHKEGYHN